MSIAQWTMSTAAQMAAFVLLCTHVQMSSTACVVFLRYVPLNPTEFTLDDKGNFV